MSVTDIRSGVWQWQGQGRWGPGQWEEKEECGQGQCQIPRVRGVNNQGKHKNWSQEGLPWWSSKNPPSNARDMGSNSGWGTKIPHASGQLAQMLQLLSPQALEPGLHDKRSLHTASRKSLHTKTKTQGSQKKKKKSLAKRRPRSWVGGACRTKHRSFHWLLGTEFALGAKGGFPWGRSRSAVSQLCCVHLSIPSFPSSYSKPSSEQSICCCCLLFSC